MSKLNVKYLIWTFVIMALTWGSCAVCSMNGIFMKDNPVLYVPYVLGGFSPTIASYIVLRQSGAVKSFWAWLKGIFDFKHNPIAYAVVIALSIIALVLQCVISGYEQAEPLYLILMFVPMMIFGGGLEELGWRHILQPELEKKFDFTISTLITGVIWWIWHLPLFYIAGVWQYGRSFVMFGIGIMGVSFALAAVKRKTGSTWLCVLLHAFTNAWGAIYLVNDDMVGTAAAAAVLVVLSYVWLKVGRVKKTA